MSDDVQHHDAPFGLSRSEERRREDRMFSVLVEAIKNQTAATERMSAAIEHNTELSCRDHVEIRAIFTNGAVRRETFMWRVIIALFLVALGMNVTQALGFLRPVVSVVSPMVGGP